MKSIVNSKKHALRISQSVFFDQLFEISVAIVIVGFFVGVIVLVGSVIA